MAVENNQLSGDVSQIEGLPSTRGFGSQTLRGKAVPGNFAVTFPWRAVGLAQVGLHPQSLVTTDVCDPPQGGPWVGWVGAACQPGEAALREL